MTLALAPNNMEAHLRLRAALRDRLRAANRRGAFGRSLFVHKDIPIAGVSHQAGTMRFGADPATSVLGLDCRAHELDNLYVTDSSFFPSVGAVNPTLTIIANALRVADHIATRMGVTRMGVTRMGVTRMGATRPETTRTGARSAALLEAGV